MSISLLRPCHQNTEPAGEWLLANLGTEVRAYRWLGNDDPANCSSLWFGWSALMDEQSDSGYVRNTYGDAPRYVSVPLTLWGDYAGDTLTRSNHECLMAELEQFGAVDVRGDYSSHMLVLPATVRLPLDMLESLRTLCHDYPVWDESHMSELEWTLAEESWEEWARADLRSDLAARVPNGFDGDADAWWSAVDEIGNEPLREAFYRAVEDSPEPYRGEGATSVHFPRWGGIVEDIAAAIVAGTL